MHAHRVSRSALRTHWGGFGSGGLLDTECELRQKKKKLHVAQDGLYILWFWREGEREQCSFQEAPISVLIFFSSGTIYHVSMAVFMRIIV